LTTAREKSIFDGKYICIMATTFPVPGSILRYNIDFDVFNKTLTFTDILANYTAFAGGKGLLSLVDPDGIIFYQNAGWATNNFSSPDTDSGTSTWTKVLSGVNYPVDSNGNVKLGFYTVNYKVQAGNGGLPPGLSTHRAKLDYIRPLVAVLMEDHVLQSTLVVTDNTSYNILHNALPVIPTITRLMTVKAPINPVTGSPVAADVTTSSKTITIGPDIFTEMYTTLLSTTALYNMELWDTAPFLIVHDTIAGDAYLKIKADTCFCTYYDCVAAVQLQMDGIIGSDPVEYNRLRKAKDKLNDYILLWIQAVSCGQDASRWCTAIKDVLLQTVPCDCAEEEGVPIEIYPIIGGGNSSPSSPSTFRFTFGLGSAGFPGSPHQYDVHEFTDTSGSYTKGDVYQYNGTSWVFQLNTMGSKGDAGHSVNSTSANVLHNDLSAVATSAGPTVQTLMSYVFPPNTLVNNGDQAKLKAIFQYAKNANGKASFLSWNAGVVASHYTDSTITDATKFVELAAEVNMINAISQLIVGGAKRSGGFINDPVVTNASADLSAAVNILASGQEDASVGGDITCKQLYVELHSQLTGNVVGASYFAQGVEAITGGSTLHIVFASAFGSADYTTGINAYDSSHQPIAWTMSNKTVNGFDIDSLDSGTIEWSAILS
jgi:hypothetical protein